VININHNFDLAKFNLAGCFGSVFSVWLVGWLVEEKIQCYPMSVETVDQMSS
jgi:hypothetical protein